MEISLVRQQDARQLQIILFVEIATIKTRTSQASICFLDVRFVERGEEEIIENAQIASKENTKLENDLKKIQKRKFISHVGNKLSKNTYKF